MGIPIGQRAPRLGPPVPEHTTRFPAESVTFGVERRENLEMRRLDDDSGVDSTYVDGGVTIHVWDAQTGAEYLRFDCFSENPHYHYLFPDASEFYVVSYDHFAEGDDMLGWALDRLRRRLPNFLANTGGAHLAGSLDARAVASALHQVEAASRQIAATPTPRVSAGNP